MGEALSVLDDAVAALERGGVIVLPTDTVYGLAARADLTDAVRRITTLKRRPDDKAFQVLIPSGAWLDRLAEPTDAARRLADRFWPGPLTIVVAAGAEAPRATVADGTIGLRVPAQPLALEIIERSGPLAASSANRAGEATPSAIDGVRASFGDGVDVYVDGGEVAGVASTVVDVSGPAPVILREGAISAAVLDAAVRGSI
ncbi:MAG: L-threonylcarbamoyladenylate synthase [Actinomycetota bacterium]